MKAIQLYIYILLMLISAFQAKGQDTLYLASFLDVVEQNHPLIKQAKLFESIGDAYLKKGKGALDPKIESDYQTKFFKNTDYFQIWQGEAKIPTSLPIDFSLGYENNTGDFLNAENSVPANGLLYGTINLTLIRGLLFDSQRYQLRQAELKDIKSELDQQILLREVIYQATNAYIDWTISYYETEVAQNFLNLINARHVNVVQLFQNGDRPAIDTIESRMNIINAEKILLEKTDKLIDKRQKLSLYIWNENGDPLQLTPQVAAETIDQLIVQLETLAIFIDPVFSNDPKIRKFQNEIASLELKNRLEREKLKPRLDLKYNTIVNMGSNEPNPSFNFNDYKYGVYFQMPILNRKSRGELELNKAIIEQNIYEISLQEQSLNNKFQALVSRKDIQEDLRAVINEKITNSLALYDAETLKFNIGESSVFLLNSREQKLLEARMDLLKNQLTVGKLLNEFFYLKMGQ